MISTYQAKINKYLKIGLCEYKPILTAQEISTLRQRLQNEFKKKLNPTELDLDLIDDNVLKDLLLKTIFHKEIIKFVENISITVFGESTKILILPKLYVMKNYLPNPYNGKFGWHIDCGGELKHEFCTKRLAKENYVFGKLGIYLQPNGDLGGQIDVVPHIKDYYRYKQLSFNNFIVIINLKIIQLFYTYLLRLINLFKIEFSSFLFSKITINELPSTPIFFDSGTIHRGTPPSKILEKNDYFKGYNYTKDLDQNKFSIYAQIGESTALESHFFDRSKSDPDYCKTFFRQINWLEKQGSEFFGFSRKMRSMATQAYEKISHSDTHKAELKHHSFVMRILSKLDLYKR